MVIGRCLPILAIVTRRKPGALLPLEAEILQVGLSLLDAGHESFHGFGLAQAMRERDGSRALTGHGTLYKALGRLEEFGLLRSRWEDPEAVAGRPRRRLYELTREAQLVARNASTDPTGHVPRLRPRPGTEPA